MAVPNDHRRRPGYHSGVLRGRVASASRRDVSRRWRLSRDCQGASRRGRLPAYQSSHGNPPDKVSLSVTVSPRPGVEHLWIVSREPRLTQTHPILRFGGLVSSHFLFHRERSEVQKTGDWHHHFDYSLPLGVVLFEYAALGDPLCGSHLGRADPSAHMRSQGRDREEYPAGRTCLLRCVLYENHRIHADPGWVPRSPLPKARKDWFSIRTYLRRAHRTLDNLVHGMERSGDVRLLCGSKLS